MGRRKLRGRESPDEDDDSLSVSSSGTSELSEKECFDAAAALSEIADALTEKRASTRMGAIDSFCKLLCRRFCAEELENWQQTLLAALKTCLRKGDVSEGTAALRAVLLMVVSLGMGGDTLSKDIREMTDALLSKAILKAPIAAAAARLAAVNMFIHGDSVDTLDTMDSVGKWAKKLASKGCAPEASVAVLSWSMLTTQHPRVLKSSAEYLPILQTLLEHDDLTVRVAAGQCIGMLFSIYNARNVEEDGDEELVFESGKEKLLETLHGMVAESSKRISKADRREQRGVMRDVLAVVEGHEDDGQDKMQIGKETIMIRDWRTRMLMQAWRGALGEGLHTHLSENQLLRDIFMVSEATTPGGRMVVSAGSSEEKNRFLKMSKARRMRQDVVMACSEEWD